ncbi:MAG: cation:proton antiporter [Gordonia sp. (in: high G+C Gram-positive bacteria)]|uniref:cation:proton antiporter domain-containing protein n=1 Tax=Gordonia sp. (in: high G+C Gram-positive bacteria) TaxID=84139 RepID=UPI0039E63E39
MRNSSICPNAIGQIGVVLLIGLAATELDMDFIRRRARPVATIGLIGMLVPALAGVAVGLWVPQAMRSDSSTGLLALMTAAAMSVSAIPIIAKILTEMGLLHRNVGQIVLAAATVKDAIAWILVAVASAAVTIGASVGAVSSIVAATIGAFAVALLVLRPLVGRALTRYEASPHASSGTFVPGAAAFILGCAALTQFLHLEAVLGGFLAGLIIGPRAPHLLAPLRTVTMTVLMPLFLANSGLRVDLTTLADPVIAVSTVMVLVVAVASTFAGSYLGGRVGGLSRWEATAAGSGLNARGALEIIIASTGLRLGIFSVPMYTAIVIVAVLTSVMAPVMSEVVHAADRAHRGGRGADPAADRRRTERGERMSDGAVGGGPPTVTVIMPMFDAADTVVAAAESILAEPIPGLELLVVDDGSTDGGADALAVLDDPRVRVVRKENGGLVSALNRGLDEATGEFIGRMDADDLSVPGRLAAQLDWLRARPAAVACGTDYEHYGAFELRIRTPRSDAGCRRRLFLSTCHCGASILMRRSVIEENGLRFDPDFAHAEDYEFFTRLVAFGEVGNLPIVGYRYWMHDGQVSDRHAEAQREAHLRAAVAYARRLGVPGPDPADLAALLWPHPDGLVRTTARTAAAGFAVWRSRPGLGSARFVARRIVEAAAAARA